MSMPLEAKELLHPAPGSAAEHRLRVQRAAEERAAVRSGELAAQASPMNDVEERIRIWERLHALRLPSGADHVLVKVIAAQTRSTVGQVHKEQQRRAAQARGLNASVVDAGGVSEHLPPQ
jgi:hypothetical protein